jgi:hypothetical protein
LFTPLAVVGIVAVAASACGNDSAASAGCGSGLSCAASTVSETTSPPGQQPEITPSAATATSSATSQPTDTTSNVSSFARTVSENGITFTLPHELQFRTDGLTSTGEFIDGFYANIPLHSACSNGCGLSTFSPLPPNAIVIGIGALSGFGVGAPNPDDPAPNTSVAGRGGMDGGTVVDAVAVVGVVSDVDVARSCVVGTTSDDFEEDPAHAPTTTDNTSTARTRPAGDRGESC